MDGRQADSNVGAKASVPTDGLDVGAGIAATVVTTAGVDDAGDADGTLASRRPVELVAALPGFGAGTAVHDERRTTVSAPSAMHRRRWSVIPTSVYTDRGNLHAHISQRSNTFDLRFDHIARRQESAGSCADAFRSAGEDEVTRRQRQDR
jgi:hypothetical protein